MSEDGKTKSKSGPKAKNRTERAYRRKQVAALRREGHTLFEIAEMLQVSRRTIHTDLRVIERHWLDEATLDLVERVRQAEADYRRVSESAWDAYYESCTEENPAGDGRFMAIALKAQEDIVALYKLDDAEQYHRNAMAVGSANGGEQSQVVEVVIDRTEIRGTMTLDQFQRVIQAGKANGNGNGHAPKIVDARPDDVQEQAPE